MFNWNIGLGESYRNITVRCARGHNRLVSMLCSEILVNRFCQLTDSARVFTNLTCCVSNEFSIRYYKFPTKTPLLFFLLLNYPLHLIVKKFKCSNL